MKNKVYKAFKSKKKEFDILLGVIVGQPVKDGVFVTLRAPDVIKVMESKMTLRGGYRFLKISKFKAEKNKPALPAFIFKIPLQKFGCPLIQKWYFQDEILQRDFDCVLVHLHSIVPQMPKERKKIERRRYYYYCEIIVTEYKWTTKFGVVSIS